MELRIDHNGIIEGEITPGTIPEVNVTGFACPGILRLDFDILIVFPDTAILFPADVDE